jgi:hypothetical protein
MALRRECIMQRNFLYYLYNNEKTHQQENDSRPSTIIKLSNCSRNFQSHHTYYPYDPDLQTDLVADIICLLLLFSKDDKARKYHAIQTFWCGSESGDFHFQRRVRLG